MTTSSIPGFEHEVDPLDGFESPNHYGRVELPGTTWATGNMFEHTILWMPNADMENRKFHDKVWDNESPYGLSFTYPEDRVFMRLFDNDAVRRLQAIEQLTLPPKYSTVPNTAAFSRFEHVWGSVLFVRQMAERYGITGKEAATLQLRTLVSDVAHTIGSHLGDWMFQGVGGSENQHDVELMQYLETTGINDILREEGFEPKDVVFPDINDWVESSQPDLCVDRVDYGLREMNRWNLAIHGRGFSSKDFLITPEGMLAMKDQQRARIFSEGFLLLSQENWSEPTHRFMTDMLMLRTKLFYGEGRAPRTWVFERLPALGLVALSDIHPRDLMYVTDPAQSSAYTMPDLAGHTLEAIMDNVARYRRQYVWPGRKDRIYQYMTQFMGNESYAAIRASGDFKRFDDESLGSFGDEYPATIPNGFAILGAEEAEATANDMCFDFPQPPLKTRQIDPLIQVKGGFKRLSELDSSYGKRLEEHRRLITAQRVARLVIPDTKSRQLLRDILNGVEDQWKHRLATSRRMTPDELRELVETSSREIIGPYPFMSFFEF